MHSGIDRIIIAGAGPVGLTAALLIAQSGIPVTIVEAEPTLSQDIRAAGFQPPTLDLLEPSGATEALLSMGLVCPLMQYRDRLEGKVVELDLGLLKNDTRHPYRLQCEQFKLTGWIVSALARIPGVDIRFATKLCAVSQSDDDVTATLEGPSGEAVLGGRYLIGADGGHSTVRQQLNSPFEGKTYGERFVQIGTPCDLRAAISDLCSINFVADDRRKPFVIAEVPGLWRFGMAIPDHITDEAAMDLDDIQRTLQEFAPRGTTYDISHRSIFRIHQRVARFYRVGRVFLAGDAAHLNNPVGGMGMNGGLHDAISLAGRLARVWHGEAGESDLEGYEAQRRPEALHAINVQTDANFRDLVETDGEVRRHILERWRRIATDQALAYQHLLQTSMIASLRSSGMIA